jgi:hypothetical protein
VTSISGGDPLVAVGTDQAEESMIAAAWRFDGDVAQSIAVDLAGGAHFGDVVATSSGAVAVGAASVGERMLATVWSLQDDSFRPETLPAGHATDESALTSIDATLSTLIAVGRSRGTSGVESAIVLRQDAAGWTRATLPDSDSLDIDPLVAAISDGRWIATSVRRDGSRLEPVLWSSTDDGLTWQRLVLPGSHRARVTGIASFSGTPLLLGTEWDGEANALATWGLGNDGWALSVVRADDDATFRNVEFRIDDDTPAADGSIALGGVAHGAGIAGAARYVDGQLYFSYRRVAEHGLPLGDALASRRHGELVAIAPTAGGVTLARSKNPNDVLKGFEVAPPTGAFETGPRTSFTTSRLLVDGDNLFLAAHEYPVAITDSTHGSQVHLWQRGPGATDWRAADLDLPAGLALIDSAHTAGGLVLAGSVAASADSGYSDAWIGRIEEAGAVATIAEIGGPDGQFLNGLAVGDTWWAVGGVRHDDDTSNAKVWSSTDAGKTWVETTGPYAKAGTSLLDVCLTTAGQPVVVGNRVTAFETIPVAWLKSTSGWSEITLGDDIGWVSTCSPTDTGIMLGGSQGRNAVIWTGTDETVTRAIVQPFGSIDRVDTSDSATVLIGRSLGLATDTVTAWTMSGDRPPTPLDIEEARGRDVMIGGVIVNHGHVVVTAVVDQRPVALAVDAHR